MRKPKAYAIPIQPFSLLVAVSLVFLLECTSTVAGEAPSAGFSEAEANNDSSWRIRGGYMWRQLGRVRFDTRSIAGETSLDWLARGGNAGNSGFSTTVFGPTTTVIGPDPGSPGGFADRFYDDGYVRVDGGTAFTGDTWYWGYSDASQVSGDTLRLSTTSSMSSRSVTTSHAQAVHSSRGEIFRNSDELGWDDELSGSGVFFALESPSIELPGNLGGSLDLAYSFVGADSSQKTSGVFRGIQTSRTMRSGTRTLTTTTFTTSSTITDSYDVSGIIVPTAPYAGTLAGPGVLIGNIPDNRAVSTSSSPMDRTVSTTSTGRSVIMDRVFFNSVVMESLDLDVHTLSLGPRVSKNWERLRLSVAAGGTVNFADWDAAYQERLYVTRGDDRALLRQWRRSNQDLDILPGVYAELSLDLQLSDNLHLFGSGRYDWADAIEGSVGPSSFNVDLEGWSIFAGVVYSF